MNRTKTTAKALVAVAVSLLALAGCASAGDVPPVENENLSGNISYDEQVTQFSINMKYGDVAIVGKLTKPVLSMFGTFNADIAIGDYKLTGTILYDVDREKFDLKAGEAGITGFVRHDSSFNGLEMDIAGSALKGTIRLSGADRVWDLSVPTGTVKGAETNHGNISTLDLDWAGRPIKGTKRIRAAEFEYHLNGEGLEMGEVMPFVLIELDDLMSAVAKSSKNPYSKG